MVWLIQWHSDIYKCELSVQKLLIWDYQLCICTLRTYCSVNVMLIENTSHSFKSSLFSNYIVSCYRPNMYLYNLSLLVNNLMLHSFLQSIKELIQYSTCNVRQMVTIILFHWIVSYSPNCLIVLIFSANNVMFSKKL